MKSRLGMSKSFVFTIAAIATIVLVTGVCAFIKSRPKAVPQMDEKSIEIAHKFESNSLVLIPDGTTFSNAVAILGTDYTTSETNTDGAFYVVFNNTNVGGGVRFSVKSNAVVRRSLPKALERDIPPPE